MNRCVFLRTAVGLMAVSVSASAFAQDVAVRTFPGTALRGQLQVGQPPEVQVNGEARRLAPGARIRGRNNLLQLSATLTGQKLWVNYTQDASGLLQDVWILTEAELERRPWPTTVEQAQAWTFDPSSQTWTR